MLPPLGAAEMEVPDKRVPAHMIRDSVLNWSLTALYTILFDAARSLRRSALVWSSWWKKYYQTAELTLRNHLQHDRYFSTGPAIVT